MLYLHSGKPLAPFEVVPKARSQSPMILSLVADILDPLSDKSSEEI
jgi:hypothetical protein